MAFFWVPTPEKGMLGLWSIGTSPLRMRLHIAFQVELPQVFASVHALRAAGLTPLDQGGGRPIEEPQVLCWMPAASVYFDDPDGHSLEFICMLDEAPRPELGRVVVVGVAEADMSDEVRVEMHDGLAEAGAEPAREAERRKRGNADGAARGTRRGGGGFDVPRPAADR